MKNLKNLQPPKSATMDIFLSDCSIIFLVLLFDISANESPNSLRLILILLLQPTNSSQREKIPYICDLRARIGCEPLSEHPTHSDRVTNIGYLLSLGASPLLRKSGLYFFFVFCFTAVVAVVVVAASVVAEAALCSS